MNEMPMDIERRICADGKASDNREISMPDAEFAPGERRICAEAVAI